MPKYEWYEDKSGGYRWRLRASNGRVLASGEGYTRRQDVLRGIAAHRRAAATAKVVEVAA